MKSGAQPDNADVRLSLSITYELTDDLISKSPVRG